MTKESVQAGAALTQEPTTRKLADGKDDRHSRQR